VYDRHARNRRHFSGAGFWSVCHWHKVGVWGLAMEMMVYVSMADSDTDDGASTSVQ